MIISCLIGWTKNYANNTFNFFKFAVYCFA